MKKQFYVWILCLLPGLVQAQETTEKVPEKYQYLALHVGVGFPVGKFGSDNATQTEAGFAKAGVTAKVQYVYKLAKTLGVGASGFYNFFNAHKSILVDPPSNGGGVYVSLDHWQFYGLAIGPTLTFDMTDNVSLDLRGMVGVATANAPRVNYLGVALLKEDWSTTTVFQGGANLRVNTNNSRLYVFANADYTYLDPDFTITSYDNSYSEKIRQRMSALSLTGGVAFRL
jgi:hypothetical protein